MAHKRKVSARTGRAETVAIPDAPQIEIPEEMPRSERMYWAGCLPTIESVTLQLLKQHKDEGEENAFENRAVTSSQMWNPKRPGEPRVWLGKCRFYQNLTVTGHEFMAYSENIVAGSEGPQADRLAWPGSLVVWSDEDLARVKQSCQEHVIRVTSQGAKPRAQLLSLRQGMTTRENLNPQANPKDREVGVEKIRFHPRTDTYVGEYVYIVPMDYPVDTPREEYPSLVPTMNQFFVDPPKALMVRRAARKPEAVKA